MKILIWSVTLILTISTPGCFTAERSYTSNSSNEKNKINTANQNLSNITNKLSNREFQDNRNYKDFVNQGIHAVDFKNFTYNWFPNYHSSINKRKIVLRNGKNESVEIPKSEIPSDSYQESLANVSYADLTGDGKDEAIITVEVDFYKWSPMCIFVFTEENKNPKEIWRYETGTIKRGFRGLKIENNNLVIEEYDEVHDNPPRCCPKRYFRTTFSWQGNTFKKINEELLEYNLDFREFIGYPSSQ